MQKGNLNMENVIDPTDDDLPQKVNETTPKLVSINTKLYVALLLVIVLNIFQGFWINSANERAETNTELMFVKMYPNGTWDVEYRKSGEEADFFPLTIDKLIHDYVEARYGVQPSTIHRDYGFAIVFQSKALANNFVGTAENQYNAKKKANELSKAGYTEEIAIRFTDHFDVSKGQFIQGNSDVYRTNVFIERTIKNPNGYQQGDPIQEVVTLHWRLKSFKELKKFTRDQLRANPIGVEIIKEKKTLDLSATN